MVVYRYIQDSLIMDFYKPPVASSDISQPLLFLAAIRQHRIIGYQPPMHYQPLATNALSSISHPFYYGPFSTISSSIHCIIAIDNPMYHQPLANFPLSVISHLWYQRLLATVASYSINYSLHYQPLTTRCIINLQPIVALLL